VYSGGHGGCPVLSPGKPDPVTPFGPMEGADGGAAVAAAESGTDDGAATDGTGVDREGPPAPIAMPAAMTITTAATPAAVSHDL